MGTEGLPFFEGQRLCRREFHELYKATPEDFRAELIGGIVYFKGRVTCRHGELNATVAGLLGTYKWKTPGVDAGLHASTALDDSSEVHPDVMLRIPADRGGQTRIVDDIIHGAPELVVEVADRSRSIDLGHKLADYERAGTLEYIVFAIDPDEVFWHIRQAGRLVRILPDPDGFYRSKVFPGLWLDLVALLAEDGPAMIATLDRGLASEEHIAFVAKLGNARPRGV